MPTRRELQQALDELEGPIRRRWLEAVRDATDATSIAEVERLIESGDTEGIGEAIALGSVATASGILSGTTEAMRDAYLSGGRTEQTAARIRFDIRNEQAERWLREQSSGFVTRVVEQQREAIRITVESGTRLGQGPRRTALDIAGRIDRTGRRKGGIVGLNSEQAQYVANAREQLRSGDPATMQQYLNRTRRDRRFDGIVRRAIAEERAVSQADVDRLTGRYGARLLEKRGEDIARTEAMQGFNSARDQAWEQSIEEGNIARENVRKTWQTAGPDGRRRDTHIAMQGQQVRHGEPFTSPSGARLLHPGDTSLGAPASEIVDCRCVQQVSGDFIGEQASREAG